MFIENKNYYKWIILLIATIAQLCATFVTYGMGPVSTFYQKEFHLSHFEAGLIVSAVNIGPILSMVIFGDLMDKYGEKFIVGLGAILLGINILLVNLINSYIPLLVVLVFVGIWYGTAQPGGSSAIVKWFPNNHRGLAMGVRQTGIPIGGALASGILPYFFYKFNLSTAINVQGIVAIVGGLIFLIFYKDVKLNKNTANIKFTKKIKLIKENKELYPIFFIGIMMISLQLIIVAHLMGFWSKTLNISLTSSGLLLSISLFGGMIGRIILAWISDTVFSGNRSKPLQLTIWLAIIVIIIMSVLSSYLPFWANGVLSFILGFLGIGWFSLFIVLVSEKANENFVTLTVSVALTLNQFFIVIAPSLFGILIDTFNNYNIPFLLLALLMGLGSLWLKVSESKKTHKIQNLDINS
ncbi:MFS transporter [Heyndrickxia ginsengihumi]|uniref:MFS transporter n=1 Tax=Heyndrickxia ginsengihumi TaxID=363870 RepID=UPI003D1B873E